MTIVSVGKQVNETREGAFDVTEWSCDVPISQAVFRYLGEFSGQTTTEKTTNIQLAAYVAPGRAISESANDVLIDTGNSVRVFTNWFGPPAYDNLSIVVGPATDSLPGLVYASPGVIAGWSSLVTQSMGRSRGGSGVPPRTMRTFLDEAFSCQVSGQWWGNTVAPASFHDAWLSAGFANFSTSLYDLAAYLNLEEYRDHWVKAREAILVTSRYGVKINEIGPLWMGVLNDTYKTPTASMVLNTSKGGYILQMLRSMMWDPQTQDADFRAMIQDYVKQFANQAVSTEDFQSLVEKHMKRPMDMDGNHRMDWFFGEWVYGTDVPSYRLEYSLAAESGGKRLLTGKLTQSGVSPGFKMIVPVFAELAGQKVRVATMAMRGDSTRDVKVMLPEAPKRILLNLNHDVLTDKEEVTLMK
jgi:aminopeptidase N